MKSRAIATALVLLLAGSASAAREAHRADEYRQLSKVTPLPKALDPDFQFRKTKLMLIGDVPGSKVQAPLFSRGGPRDPAVGFETAYRLWGAITALDYRQRHGNYFDFFWRAKRPASVTVRLEYRQSRLRAATQAREVTYPNAKGSHRTSFAISGDDFHNDGHVLSWRCLLIERGRIVAEERSYLWR
jgi:hypothetical protein